MIGRHKAMIEAGVNQPIGRRYNEAFGAWQREFGFENLDKGDRARLFEVMGHLAKIEAWLATLTTSERLRLNHPTTVLRKWKGSTVVPDPNATPKPSPYAQLKDAHAQLIEENHRLQHRIEAADGDLWKTTDTAADIAGVMVAAVAREGGTHCKGNPQEAQGTEGQSRPSVEAGGVCGRDRLRRARWIGQEEIRPWLRA